MNPRITKPLLMLFIILSLSPSWLLAQNNGLEQLVSGIVTDSDGQPLIGVNVYAENITTGTSTDVDGVYQLSLPGEVTAIVFSYTGFTDQVVEINGRTTINVTMQTDVTLLDEVVIVGYGKQKKSDLTGAVSSVNVEALQKLPTADVGTALQGQAAGVNVSAATGAPGASPVIRIRGLGTIGNNDPLYVIDGIPGDLSYINPADIESINVLRDASAATIYGARASNGVVIITTKRGKTGEPRVTLNTYIASQRITNSVDMANKAQYNQIMKDGRANGGEAPLDYTLNDNEYADTDWANAYIEDAFEQKYDLGISGGTDKMSYHFSGGYFKNSGTVINTGFDRYNARLNLDFKLLNDRVTVSPGMSYTRDKSKNIFEPTGGGNASFSPFLYAFTALPHKEIYDP